jgi:hypothetical protein
LHFFEIVILSEAKDPRNAVVEIMLSSFLAGTLRGKKV